MEYTATLFWFVMNQNPQFQQHKIFILFFHLVFLLNVIVQNVAWLTNKYMFVFIFPFWNELTHVFVWFDVVVVKWRRPHMGTCMKQRNKKMQYMEDFARFGLE